MYRTILLPLDGSSFSELALPTAAALATAVGAKIVLVRAAGGPVPAGTSPTEAEAEAVWEAKRYLARIARELANQRIEVEIAAPYLPPCEGILQERQLRQADLIVMCTHARLRLGRWLYGSVAEQVLSQTPVPVLLLRPADAVARPLAAKGSSLLVPLDGSVLAEATLPHARALAQVLQASLVLLRVIPIPSYRIILTDGSSAMEQLIDREQAEADTYLAEVSQGLTHAGLKVETRTSSGRPVDVIVEQGEASGVGLVVMSTHGDTGMDDQIMGSVARGVLERGSRPLLLVPPQPASNLKP